MTEKTEQLLDINQNYLPISPSAVIIDLTGDNEDDRPPIKKIIIRNNGDGDYVTIDHHEDQPGPSGVAQRKLPKSHNNCLSCGARSNSISFINLECNHCFCYDCFYNLLKGSDTSLIICPEAVCQHKVGDSEIKNFLQLHDYVFFLEHTRDILRNELSIRNVENSFLSAAEGDATQPYTPQFAVEDDIIVIPDFPATPKLTTPITRRRRSELIRLENLEQMSYVKNTDVFECPVCIMDIDVGKGVTLKNCLHNVCTECFERHVSMCDDPEVFCPCDCEFLIDAREIRAIVSIEIYDVHISKGMKRAEAILENIHHCKTPDCVGFIQSNEDSKAFVCPVCDKVNCVKCKTIHEDKTCEEYQADLVNDAKNQRELQMTEAAVKEMIAKGEAMLCPQCDVLIQKQDGCDWVQCLSCKLGICYLTKKPRKPITRVIDGKPTIIDGCHCKEKGKKCHPKCGNCH